MKDQKRISFAFFVLTKINKTIPLCENTQISSLIKVILTVTVKHRRLYTRCK